MCAVVSLDGYQDYTIWPKNGAIIDAKLSELKEDWAFTVTTDDMIPLSDLGILQVTGTGQHRANCNVAVFDNSTGKLVSQGGALRCSQGGATEAPIYVVDDIPAGTYTVVGWQENDYFSRISSVDDFAAMGLTASDYASETATVAKGKTVTVKLDIPRLDTSKISALLATGDVTIASYYNPIDVPFAATVKYNMTTGQTVDSVQVSIPEWLEPVAAATTAKRYYSKADGIDTGSWDVKNHVLTISDLDEADRQSGKIALSLKATTAGSYVVSASLTSGTVTAPLGGASVECPAIRLVVPEGTLPSKTFTVHVYAAPSSNVELKIGNTVLDTACTTNALEHAKVSVTIPDKELSFSSYYQVTATLKDSTEDPKPSDTALVEYNSYLDDLPLEPTIYDFYFESAGQKVVLSDKGDDRSGGFYTVASTQHKTIFSTAWPFTASIDSLQPLEDEATLYLGMLDNSVRSFTLGLSGTEDLPSGAKRYTYSGTIELNLDGKDDWRSDEIPCRFDVMPGITSVETVQPNWTTSTDMDALKLGVNADVERLIDLGAKGFNDWYNDLNATGQKCVSGEYFYTSKLGTDYGYKYYNDTLAEKNYDYVFGVFNNNFRHEKWDPTGEVWTQMSQAERTAFEEAEEQIATAYDALALLLGDSKPMYEYETYEAYLAAECGYTEGGSYDKSALEDEGYLVVDNLFGDTWTAMRAEVPDDGQALPTIDDLKLTTQGTTRERIGSFQTKDGKGEAANKKVNDMTDVDILLDTIEDSTKGIMENVRKVDPETGALIDGFAVKDAGLVRSIYEPVDDEIKSRSDYTGISSELKNRQEELARMEEMNKFYDRKNPGSLCQKALQAEIEYMKQCIADLEWAKRFAWYGEMGTVTGGAMIEYTKKINDAADTYIKSIKNDDVRGFTNIGWDFIEGLLEKGKILGLAARQAYGSQAAAASMLMAPDLAKHRAQVQQWRFYRERECKNDDFGELHYHVKPAIDPSGFTYEGVQMAEPYTTTVAIPDDATYYYVTPGATPTFTKGSGDMLSFTFKRTARDELTFQRFQGILVDGAAVDASNYSYAPGSVIVALKAAYLETLAEGDHVLTAQFADGSATADFTVTAEKGVVTPAKDDGEADSTKDDSSAKPAKESRATATSTTVTRTASPATGDQAVPISVLLLVAAIACGIALVARRRATFRGIGKQLRR